MRHFIQTVFATITVTHDNDAPTVQIQDTELELDIPHSCDGTDLCHVYQLWLLIQMMMQFIATNGPITVSECVRSIL